MQVDHPKALEPKASKLIWCGRMPSLCWDKPFALKSWLDAREALVGEVIEAGSNQSEGKAEDDHNEPASEAGWNAALGDLIGEAEGKAQEQREDGQPVAFEAEGFTELDQAKDDDKQRDTTDGKLSDINHETPFKRT